MNLNNEICYLGIILECNIYSKYYFEMQEEEEMPFQMFTDESKQLLFDTLASNVAFSTKPFSQQDFRVDLVLRLKVPKQAFINKEWEITYDKLFKNTPQQYEQVYQEMLEYIHYLTVTDPRTRQANLPENIVPIRCMTTLKSLMKPEAHRKTYINRQSQQEHCIIDCQYQFLPILDTFTLMYNMLMVILERDCGFHTRTFLLQNEQDEDSKNGSVVYFLLSQSNQNLMKIADKIELKKQVEMIDIDYTLNEPTDNHQRPIKYHSSFQQLPDFESFLYEQKMLSRTLGIKEINMIREIFDEAHLEFKDGVKYRSYCEQLFKQIVELQKSRKITISSQEKSYIFDFNRNKINEGCIDFLYKTKFRRLIYEKMKELNKKYGYNVHTYDDAYFEFKKPTKSKPFFHKLGQLLCYKYYTMSHSGELSLFTKLQRIKLAYFNLQTFFKTQNFAAVGIEIYALHDNFERFGDRTVEDNNHDEDAEGKLLEVEVVSLKSCWHPLIPFLSSVKKIRDYMGENVAFQVMIKIYLTTFFLCVTPLSVVSEMILQGTFNNHIVNYKFAMIELAVMVFSLSLFVQIWQKNQNRFFDNFVHVNKIKVFREGYKGPYFRNLITDQANQHQMEKNLRQQILNVISIFIILTILTLEGVFFWGMRLSIVACYKYLPPIAWNYITLPHLIFYGVYFLANYFLYYLIFLRLINWLVSWQNYPTKAKHDQKVRLYQYYITFGVELMGPLFFYIVEPLQRVSCYAAECTDQFSNYIYSRYQIIFIYIFFKFHHFIITALRTGLAEQIIKDERGRIQQYLSFENRLNYLLSYVKDQYRKGEVVEDLRDESLALYYYVIFKINFPFCTILTFLFLHLDYVFERIENFRNKRRPIPITETLYRMQNTFLTILHICIIFNSWAITFTYQFLEYDFKEILEYFLINITQDNILTMKIFVACAIGLFFEILSFILRKLFQTLAYDPLQKRKQLMYQKYLYKIREKPTKIKLPYLLPVKAIFRTFTYDGIMQHKKQKYKLYEAYKNQAMRGFYGKKLTLMGNDHTRRRMDEEEGDNMETNCQIIAT